LDILAAPSRRRHDARRRALGQGFGQGEKVRHAEVVVELGGDVAGQFQMLFLVLAGRHFGGLVEQDVGRLQHRIGVEADAGPLLVLARLLLELGHPVQPAEAGDAVEDPGQFGVRAHGRLGEDDRLRRIEARGQIGGGDLARLGGQQSRVLPDGDGVQIGDEQEAGRALILQLGEAFQGAEIVAQMQGARGLDARKHPARTGVLRGGSGGGGRSVRHAPQMP
jgi:hypothetical protein